MRKDYYSERAHVFLFCLYDTIRKTDSDLARTHLHAESELALITHGNAEYVLGNDKFPVSKNDVIFVPPGVTHAVISPSDGGLKTLTLRVSSYCLREFFTEFVDGGKMTGLLGGQRRGKITSPNTSALFLRLNDTFRTGDRFNVKAAFLNLVCEICKSIDPEKSLPKKSHDGEIRKAVAFITENCGRAVLLSDMADAVGMSRTRFAEAFRSNTGITPHDFLLITRVEKAENLLRNCDASITEIAFESGFDNVAGFNKAFKKKNGITPSEFRKRQADL